jgi:hypothetical protein
VFGAEISVLYTANKGQARVAVTTMSKGVVTARAGNRRVSAHSSEWTVYMMADDLGFPRRKRGEHGRAGKSASARLPKRADDPSRGVVAQEALDVAHYITDMTAQLEAMAVAARLDLLAYFLGMAKAESELFVRTNAVAEAEHEANAEAEAEESYAAESAIRQPHASNSFD